MTVLQIESSGRSLATWVLAASGMTLDDVVTSVFLKDLNDFAKMNGVYGTYFMDKPVPNSYRHRVKARRR